MKEYALECLTTEKETILRWLKSRGIKITDVSYISKKLRHISYVTDEKTFDELCEFTKANFGW